jgi:hypothetical protein
MGEATATKMVAAAAEADPYLRAVLEDMGLITVGAAGTISVNFDDVKDAHDSVDALTRTIQHMILAMDGVPAEVKTEILLERADESVGDLITYYNWLNSIPGNVVTTIETRYVVRGADGSVHYRGSGSYLGGVVGYAGGGVDA